MQLLLDIPDNKANFVLELLKNLRFVKTKSVSTENTIFLHELDEAVKEMNDITKNKKTAKKAEDFLNEL